MVHGRIQEFLLFLWSDGQALIGSNLWPVDH